MFRCRHSTNMCLKPEKESYIGEHSSLLLMWPVTLISHNSFECLVTLQLPGLLLVLLSTNRY